MDVNDFDRLAPYYDSLARLVFGNSILKSQSCFFELLHKDSEVLIIGGGTGKMLSELPLVRSVTYCEKSGEMIRLAKKKASQNSITFQQGDFLEGAHYQQFDAVICPFFLDCFMERNLQKVIRKIKQTLRPGGYLFVADFEYGMVPTLIGKAMHHFFRVAANLESGELKSIHHFVVSNHFDLLEEKFFYQNMIFSRVYRNL